MKLVLETNVFSPNNSVQLHALLELVLSGRHRIDIEDEQHPIFREWLTGLRPEDRDYWEQAVADGLKLEALEPALLVAHVAPTQNTDWTTSPPRISLREAAVRLAQPFRILVENSISDRRFLLSMAGQRARAAIEKLEANGFLEFENGGGITNMHSILRRRANEPWRVNQCFVLFDSDAEDPGVPGPSSDRIKNLCISLGVAFHQLKRRNVENYILREALRAWAFGRRSVLTARKRIFEAFLSMTDDQRYYFSLKYGFIGRRHSQQIYVGMDARDMETLKHGFGTDITLAFDDFLTSDIHLHRDSAWAEVSPLVNRLLALLR